MVAVVPALRPLNGAGELFQLLRDGAPRTRAELAALTGLARSTVASRIETLMSLGLVAPIGDAASTGGRPSSQFALNAAGKVVVAVALGASHSAIALSDLLGTVIEEERDSIDIADGPEVILTHVMETVRRLLEKAARSADDIIAVGMGLPGPVQFATGRPSNPPIMPGWDDFDVPGWMRRHLRVPVLVDNDVNVMALGERALYFPDVDDLVFIKVATGIGAGIISSGQLQRGAQGIAGDIGHVRVESGAGVPCRCGNVGCLEAVASGPAIAAALRRQGLEWTTAAEVLDAARRGSPQATASIRQAGRDIGEVLTACISFINPAVVVLGGSVASAGEQLLAGVREVAYSRSAPLAAQNLAITQSRAAERAGVVGAATLAIQEALSPEGLELIAS